MAVSYTRTSGGRVDGQPYREMARNLQDILEQEIDVAAQEGEAEAKGFIGIAGTQSEWTGPFKGREGPNAGRIDTGNMQDKITYSIGRGGRDISIRLGWLHVSDDERAYMTAQDEGFSAGGFRNAQTVEGMGMMAHLRFYMRDRVDMAMDRAIRRIVDGL